MEKLINWFLNFIKIYTSYFLCIESILYFFFTTLNDKVNRETKQCRFQDHATCTLLSGYRNDQVEPS